MNLKPKINKWTKNKNKNFEHRWKGKLGALKHIVHVKGWNLGRWSSLYFWKWKLLRETYTVKTEDEEDIKTQISDTIF